MKKTFTIALLFISIFSFSRDIGIVQIAPNALTELKAGETRNINLILKAYNAFEIGETMAIKYRINDGVTKVSIEKMQLMMLAENQTSPLLACPIRVPNLDNDTVKITMIIELIGDDNYENDTLSINYIVKTRIKNDLEISITKPSFNQEVHADSTYEFWVNYKNVGSNNFETGTTLLSFITIDGAFQGQPNQSIYAGQSLAPDESSKEIFQLTFTKADVGKSIPVCYHSFWSELTDTSLNTIEGNYNDNAGCVSVTIISPTSVATINNAVNSLYINNNNLIVSFKNSTDISKIEVWNIEGKQVLEKLDVNAFGSSYIDVNTLENGIYLLSATTKRGAVYTKKFVKN